MPKIETIEYCGICGNPIPDGESPEIWGNKIACATCLKRKPKPAPPTILAPEPPKQYGGLQTAKFVLGLMAALQYFAGAYTLIMAVTDDFSAYGTQADKIRGFVAAIGISLLSFGAILHGLSSASDALRDIARKMK
jgi:hypothetical protein